MYHYTYIYIYIEIQIHILHPVVIIRSCIFQHIRGIQPGRFQGRPFGMLGSTNLSLQRPEMPQGPKEVMATGYRAGDWRSIDILLLADGKTIINVCPVHTSNTVTYHYIICDKTIPNDFSHDAWFVSRNCR